MKVYLVSFVGMKVDADSAVLMKALEKRGVDSKSVSWDDPSVDWAEPDLCIIKSASNYGLQPESFIRWARTVEEKTLLWNKCSLVEWNHDKHYLKDLESKGVPIPPSIFVEKESEERLGDILSGKGWSEIVIKPTISAGSFGLKRFKIESDEAEQHLQELTKRGFSQEFMGDTYMFSPRDAIVQPYIPEIVYGEVSLLYFGGVFSHAVIKKAKAGDFRSHPIWGASVTKHTPSVDELRVGERVLNAMEPTEYARVDLVNTPKDPLVIEVELIEPFLFFDMFPETAEVFADHIKRSR
jgi:glutathione synthase/RimK-type ligase-like ATP-grasp enzyme